jgi:Cytochrome c
MSRRKRTILASLLGVAVLLGGVLWYQLLREEPSPVFADDAEHFKYGSVGVEAANGVPYWIWVVLPRIFADKIPDGTGYRSFGFVWEDGRDTPVGFARKTVGFPRLGINCGLCHVGTVRADDAERPRLLVGAPNTTLDLQRYLRFLFASAEDPRFTADRILDEIATLHSLSPVEKVVYRFIVIPQTKRALLRQKRELAWMDDKPNWGAGRVDPFNPAKVQILKRPYDGTIGAADIVPLWNFRPRGDFGLHWDGLNTSLTEVFRNSGIGNGASAKSVDLPSLERIQAWILDLKPAQYPFAIDRGLAERGQGLFAAHCAACHAVGGEKTGTPIPDDLIGTDRSRLDSWTESAQQAFNALDEYRWRYTHFRKTSGYVTGLLDGIWTRAPYLHNGSVPTLWALLTEPSARPQKFYRGYDVFDPKAVGFVVSGEAAQRSGRLFDTSLPGNGNGGHRFGTGLPDADKWALIEYMKSL